jgi:phosphoribosylformimino-5-aminoimidazole carboxamide ribotide isomerase
VVNWEVIETIVTAVQVPTQLGGGIRTLETIQKLLKAGLERVILGTVAVEDPDLVKTACRKWGDYIIVSIDARNGQVAIRGWREATRLSAIALAKDMVKMGVQRFVYTDIAQDGTLGGPNFSALTELMAAVGKPVVAAGGISSLSHIEVLKRIGAEGAIIGKALYTGDIDLKQALKIAN